MLSHSCRELFTWIKTRLAGNPWPAPGWRHAHTRKNMYVGFCVGFFSHLFCVCFGLVTLSGTLSLTCLFLVGCVVLIFGVFFFEHHCFWSRQWLLFCRHVEQLFSFSALKYCNHILFTFWCWGFHIGFLFKIFCVCVLPVLLFQTHLISHFSHCFELELWFFLTMTEFQNKSSTWETFSSSVFFWTLWVSVALLWQAAIGHTT